MVRRGPASHVGTRRLLSGEASGGASRAETGLSTAVTSRVFGGRLTPDGALLYSRMHSPKHLGTSMLGKVFASESCRGKGEERPLPPIVQSMTEARLRGDALDVHTKRYFKHTSAQREARKSSKLLEFADKQVHETHPFPVTLAVNALKPMMAKKLAEKAVMLAELGKDVTLQVNIACSNKVIKEKLRKNDALSVNDVLDKARKTIEEQICPKLTELTSGKLRVVLHLDDVLGSDQAFSEIDARLIPEALRLNENVDITFLASLTFLSAKQHIYALDQAFPSGPDVQFLFRPHNPLRSKRLNETLDFIIAHSGVSVPHCSKRMGGQAILSYALHLATKPGDITLEEMENLFLICEALPAKDPLADELPKLDAAKLCQKIHEKSEDDRLNENAKTWVALKFMLLLGVGLLYICLNNEAKQKKIDDKQYAETYAELNAAITHLNSIINKKNTQIETLEKEKKILETITENLIPLIDNLSIDDPIKSRLATQSLSAMPVNDLLSKLKSMRLLEGKPYRKLAQSSRHLYAVNRAEKQTQTAFNQVIQDINNLDPKDPVRQQLETWALKQASPTEIAAVLNDLLINQKYGLRLETYPPILREHLHLFLQHQQRKQSCVDSLANIHSDINGAYTNCYYIIYQKDAHGDDANPLLIERFEKGVKLDDTLSDLNQFFRSLPKPLVIASSGESQI